MEEPLFIGCENKKRWKPPIKLSDFSPEYLTLCPIDYSLLRNTFSAKPEVLRPEEEAKLWQCLGIVNVPPNEEPQCSTSFQNPFYATSVEPLHSKRETKRIRRAERKNKLENWFGMSKPTVTEEEQDDLELVRLRRAISSDTHVKRSDGKFRFFQKGVVVDDPGSFYDRLQRKKRGKTMVDELLVNADVMKKQRKRYAKVERDISEKRAAVYRQKQQRLKRMKKKDGKHRATVMIPE